MNTREQHFVTFYSPGTFTSESTTRPIEAWDAAMACSMAKSIDERHASRPYGFRFSTSIVADPVDDERGGKLEVLPRQVASSGIHYIGGTVESYDDVLARNKDDERILRSNMKGNSTWFVVTTTNSWKSVNAFGPEDFTVDPETGAIVERGNSEERKAYRKAWDAVKESEYAYDSRRSQRTCGQSNRDP